MYEATVSYQIGNHTMHRLRKKKKIKYDIDENISRSFCINIQKFRTVNSSYKGHLLSFYLSFFFLLLFHMSDQEHASVIFMKPRI